MDFDRSLHFLGALLHSNGIELLDAAPTPDCAHLVFFNNWRILGYFGRRYSHRFSTEEQLGSSYFALGESCICYLVLG